MPNHASCRRGLGHRARAPDRADAPVLGRRVVDQARRIADVAVLLVPLEIGDAHAVRRLEAQEVGLRVVVDEARVGALVVALHDHGHPSGLGALDVDQAGAVCDGLLLDELRRDVHVPPPGAGVGARVGDADVGIAALAVDDVAGEVGQADLVLVDLLDDAFDAQVVVPVPALARVAAVLDPDVGEAPLAAHRERLEVDQTAMRGVDLAA